MAVVFSLWETKSGNIINASETKAAALAVVRDTIVTYGREAVATLALARETSRSVKQIAEGDALAERALAAAPSASLTAIAKPKPARRSAPA